MNVFCISRHSWSHLSPEAGLESTPEGSGLLFLQREGRDEPSVLGKAVCLWGDSLASVCSSADRRWLAVGEAGPAEPAASP